MKDETTCMLAHGRTTLNKAPVKPNKAFLILWNVKLKRDSC